VPGDDLGRVERRMYLTDWPARRVRVRRSFVRGESGTPKSKRSSRSVPLADRVAGELDQLHQETLYRHDDDLRHTFTHMAAQGVPMRALQEMLGHRDFKTTLVYADYAPSAREAERVEAAFATEPTPGLDRAAI